MLRFLQRKQRARAQPATLTQKADDNKHKKCDKNLNKQSITISLKSELSHPE